MTTPDMKPGLNFGGGPGKSPNPFQLTFIFVGFVFLILGFTSNPIFFGSGIIFLILGFVIQDGDGKGPDGGDLDGARPDPKDDSNRTREQMDQSDAEGNPRPRLGSEDA